MLIIHQQSKHNSTINQNFPLQKVQAASPGHFSSLLRHVALLAELACLEANGFLPKAPSNSPEGLANHPKPPQHLLRTSKDKYMALFLREKPSPNLGNIPSPMAFRIPYKHPWVPSFQPRSTSKAFWVKTETASMTRFR